MDSEGRKYIFLSFVVIIIFFQLFYSQFYGKLYTEAQQARNQIIDSDKEIHVKKAKAYFAAFQKYQRQQAKRTETIRQQKAWDNLVASHTIDRTLTRKLQIEAEQIIYNLIDQIALKCNGKYYFIAEGKSLWRERYREISGIKVDSDYDNYAELRARGIDRKDVINVNVSVSDEDNKYVFHPQSNRDSGTVRSDERGWIRFYRGDLIAHWYFHIEDDKLTNYPPRLEEDKKDIITSTLLKYPYNYVSPQKNSRYSCSSIPKKDAKK